jgi:hypothetical protein
MAKQALGRSLGTLLENTAKEAEKAPVSTGVRTLMRGNQPSLTTAPPVEKPVANRKAAVPIWYLFAGDVLLAVVSLAVVFGSPHPLSWQRAVFCSAAVFLGALLAIAAILLTEED